MIGPVHEKDTRDRVKAIKKIPISPPLSLAESALLIIQLGSVISNAPKKEIAKMTKMIKKERLKNALLDRSLSASDPNVIVTSNPSAT